MNKPRRKKHPGGRPRRDPSGATSPLTIRLTPAERARAETAAGDTPLATWAARRVSDAAGVEAVDRWTPVVLIPCDLCERPATWAHPDGGFRCGTCPRPVR
jgi:hypothetical protein